MSCLTETVLPEGLALHEFGDHLEFTVSGPLTARRDAGFDVAIAAACRSRGLRLALVDIRGASGRLSVLDNHEAARSMHRRIRPDVARMAIVDLPEHHERSAMFEVTALNNGMPVRFFDDVATARAWLLGMPGTPASEDQRTP